MQQLDTAATVRRVISSLEHLEPRTARYLTGLAFLLTRVADADREVLPDETRSIEAILSRYTQLPEEQAVLVTEIARHRIEITDPAGAYQVSRELRAVSSTEQRRSMLHSLFTVALADGAVSASEQAAIRQIACELGFDQEEIEAASGVVVSGHA